MAKRELVATTSPERQLITLEMRMDGKPLGHMFLSASDAEDYIHYFSRHRAELADEVSNDLDPGARLDGIVNPAWRITSEALLSDGTTTTPTEDYGLTLILRHPGMGWLSFLLPHKEAAALGKCLVDHAKPPTSDNAAT